MKRTVLGDRIRIHRAVWLVFLSGLFGVSASAATWCVATNGNDSSGTGTWAQPYLTIQKGIDAAASGDTVLVSNGTYTATVAIAKPIVVKSMNGPSLTAISKPGSTVVTITAGNPVVFDGFTVRNGTRGINIGGDGTSAQILNCIVSKNGVVPGPSQGSAVGGILNGVGYTASTALIRNCLVVGNEGWWYSAIAANKNTSVTQVESTTVTGNKFSTAVGSEGTLTGVNCIVFNNSSDGINNDKNIFNGTWSYTCSYPLRTGTANLNDAPEFEAAGTGYGQSHTGGDYRLSSASPCVNVGSDQAWMASGFDLEGGPRIFGTHTDIGAYERDAPALTAIITGSPLKNEIVAGLSPLTAVFTATPVGDVTGVLYRWDFTADGTFDTPWSSSAVATNVYAALGRYSVAVAVTNAAGLAAVKTRTNYVLVSPVNLYVALSASSGTSPYDTWGKAASNLQTAIDWASDGSTIHVSNGTYAVTAPLVVSKGVALRSVNGPDVTTIQRTPSAGNIRLLNIFNGAANWLVDGITFRGGRGHYNPQNLVNGSMAYANGGAMQVVGNGVVGVVQNCKFIANTALECSGAGLATGMGSATTVRNCLFASNTNTLYGNVGVGVTMRSHSGSVMIENCTFYKNFDVQTSDFYAFGGEMNAGGPWVAQNCIQHTDKIGANVATKMSVTYSRLPQALTGTGNILGDPLFLNAAGGDFRLGEGSPCINAGTNKVWMATATDLGGTPRLQGRVDLGAFEWLPPTGTVLSVR